MKLAFKVKPFFIFIIIEYVRPQKKVPWESSQHARKFAVVCLMSLSLWPPPATPPSANALDRSETTGHSPYIRPCPSSPHYLCSFCHFIILFCSLKSHMNQEFYLERCLLCVRIPVHIALNVHWLQIINCLSNADVHLSLYQKSWCSVIALGQNASSEKINQLQAHRAKCVGKIEINPYMQ